MAQPEDLESDRAHRSVQAVLRVGLGVAVLALLAGLGICVVAGQSETRCVRLSEMAAPMAPGLRLVMIGLVVLALTPAARALALVALWTRARDWRFVAVALAVICILTVSVAIGAG